MAAKSENTQPLIDAVNAALDPSELKRKSRYTGSQYADFIDELRGQANEVRNKATEQFSKRLPVGEDTSNLSNEEKKALQKKQADDLKIYQDEAVDIYKKRITGLISEAGGGPPPIPLEASDSFLKNIAGSTLSGAISGNVKAGLMTGILGGIKDFIMSLPYVGNLIRQTTIFFSAKWSGDEELKKMEWKDAGKEALIQRDAAAFAGPLKVDAKIIAGVLKNKQTLQEAQLDGLDGVHDGQLDLSKLDTKNKDGKLSLEELKMDDKGDNKDMLASFKEFIKDKGIKFEDGSFVPSTENASLPAPINVSGTSR